jgi:hypothetical protein
VNTGLPWISAPSPIIKALRRKVDALERQVDAAFERGDIERAEDLDAQLATLRERFTSAAESQLEDEESFDDEAGVEEQLVEAYHCYQKMENGRAFGPFNDRSGAIENMRDAIVSASGKPGSDEQVLAAAKDAYEAAAQRRALRTGEKFRAGSLK